MAKDIIRLCLDPAKYAISYVNLPIKRTHIFMQKGTLDVSIYSYKVEREEFVHYSSVPLFTSEYGFATRKDSDIQVNSLEDLEPLRIGRMPGLTHTLAVMAIIDEKRDYNMVAEGHSVEALFFQMLSDNPRFDIMPNSKATFFWQAKQLGIADKIHVLDYVLAEKNYYLSVSKKSTNIDNPLMFLKEMDDCVTEIKQDGRYQLLSAKYGFTK